MTEFAMLSVEMEIFKFENKALVFLVFFILLETMKPFSLLLLEWYLLDFFLMMFGIYGLCSFLQVPVSDLFHGGTNSGDVAKRILAKARQIGRAHV